MIFTRLAMRLDAKSGMKAGLGIIEDGVLG